MLISLYMIYQLPTELKTVQCRKRNDNSHFPLPAEIYSKNVTGENIQKNEMLNLGTH